MDSSLLLVENGCIETKIVAVGILIATKVKLLQGCFRRQIWEMFINTHKQMCVHLHKCTQYTQYIYSYYIHAYLYHLIYTSIYVCVCIRAHDFITMFPILIQYSRVLSFYLFFLFYHNCCFLSQSAKTDNHYSQFICSILESTKNGFRIANLCFCKKGGLLSSNFFFYSCFFFLPESIQSYYWAQKLLGFTSPLSSSVWLHY